MRYQVPGAHLDSAMRSAVICGNEEPATLFDAGLELHIRLRAQFGEDETERVEAQHFVEEVGAAQLTLAVNLESLERSLEGVAYDTSARAAAEATCRRIHELRDLCEALHDLYVVAGEADLALLLRVDGALADYLRGVLTWCTGVMRALEHVATELRIPAVDWTMLRERLDASSQFYLPELMERIEADVTSAREMRPQSVHIIEELDAKMAVLFAAAEWLQRSLKLRFG